MADEHQGAAAELDEVIEMLRKAKKQLPLGGHIPGITSKLDKMLAEFRSYRKSLDRPASVMVLGRAGVGKSSFMQALVNEPDFVTADDSESVQTEPVQPAPYVTSEGTETAFLTAGGGQADISEDEALKQIRKAVKEYEPTVFFVLMPPDNEHWEKDVSFFARAIDSADQGRQDEEQEITVVGIITKADTIVEAFDPNLDYNWRNPVTKSDEEIAGWCKQLKSGLENRLDTERDIDVFPVSSVFGKDGDGQEVEARFGLDEVWGWIGQHAPIDLVMKMTGHLRENARRSVAVDMVNRFSVLAGVVGAVPTPVDDARILAYLQRLLARVIHSLAGNKDAVDPEEYATLMGETTQIAGESATRQLETTLDEFIPDWAGIAGGVAKAAIAAALTEGFGRLAVAHYIDAITSADTLKNLREVAVSVSKDFR